MAVAATYVVQFAVAAVYLGLAAWLLHLNFPHRIHRLLGLVFFLRGATIAINQVTALDSARELAWHALRTYLLIGTFFALLDLLIVYTWRQPSAARRGARWFLLGLFLSAELAFLLNHEIVWTYVGPGVTYGPLAFLALGFPVVMALGATGFAHLARNTPVPAQAKFHRVFALGLVSGALAESAGPASVLMRFGWNRMLELTGTTSSGVAAQAVILAAAPAAFVAVAIMVAESWKAGNGRRAMFQLGVALVVFALPLASRLAAAGREPHSVLFFSAVPRAFAPTLLAYALVRQILTKADPFQLDLRTGIVIRRGTVGGILVAMFFVVSESAAQLFGEFAATQDLNPAVAQTIGIIGAGILLVFLHPLNRLGERLATGVLPDVRPLAQMETRERLRIYQEQAELAWADGSITRKERLLLDKLREQLHLPLGEAVRAESRAARGLLSG